MSDDLEEVLQFIRSSFGLVFHIEKDVGLGLAHGLFVRQCHSTVIEMEPAAFVGGVCCVMSRTDPAKQKSKDRMQKSHKDLNSHI